jgi:hypothetical protein
MFGMERECIPDRTLEGHESARKRGKTIGGAGVTDEALLSMALQLRDQEMSLRDIAKRLVITTGAEKGQHPRPPPSCGCCANTTNRPLRSRRRRRPVRRSRSSRGGFLAYLGHAPWLPGVLSSGRAERCRGTLSGIGPVKRRRGQ